MKKWLALVLVVVFMLSANSVLLAKGQETGRASAAAAKKAVVTDKKADVAAAKAQRDELRALIQDVKAKHQETIALMKEIKDKRQKIKAAVTALKEDDQTATQTAGQTLTDIKAVLKIMSEIKGLGVKDKGLWGQYNQARKNKDIEQAKSILQQISDQIEAKNAKLRTISATLDGILVDLAP